MSEFEEWIGRNRTVIDTLDPRRCNALDAALGGPGDLREGDTLPLLDHWLYFWDVRPPAELGEDGHPKKGGFLPPIALPRRMWAGGRLTFHKPLTLGITVSRKSTITAIKHKSGKSGQLIFVTLLHELSDNEGLAISEEQDLVYREAATSALEAPVPAPVPPCDWSESVIPDPVMLFRYSALTFNGHRIHYDRPYALEVEGYPALVVHGPLQAKLMARLAVAQFGDNITSFDFRGQAPAFDTLPLHICGNATANGGDFWTQQGPARAMAATIECSGRR